jgi:hypothetical protein
MGIILTLILYVVFEVVGYILKQVSRHASNFDCLYKVKHGCMKTFNSNIRKIFGMPNIETRVTKGADITCCKALSEFPILL